GAMPPGTPESAVPQGFVSQKRHSAAPDGMGSSLRLDDPSLRDTLQRARSEREELAAEYRQTTAPLVATVESMFEQPAQVYQQAPGQTYQQASEQAYQQAAPTYAQPGAAPSQLFERGVPRPHVVAPSESADPALRSAFQRRTPYAPVEPGTAQAAAFA
ncbi:MAG: hypothetical protein JWN41_557, partial [Thermoleophilia bacterium]|nr:hypothetical protein [Thermoleophilia bacterium]